MARYGWQLCFEAFALVSQFSGTEQCHTRSSRFSDYRSTTKNLGLFCTMTHIQNTKRAEGEIFPMRPGVTAFEERVRKLGLSEQAYATSEELRRWCERNKTRPALIAVTCAPARVADNSTQAQSSCFNV